jgi:hypothetical protein
MKFFFSQTRKAVTQYVKVNALRITNDMTQYWQVLVNSINLTILIKCIYLNENI